jgi:hypothetical protein
MCYVINSKVKSLDSSVGIAAGWTTRVRFPAVQDFSLLRSIQTESGTSLLCAGDFFPGVKRPGREADHSSN